MSFTFEVTTDADLVRSILTHPKVWRNVADDFAPQREHFQPVFTEGLLYLLLRQHPNGQALGLWMFVQHNRVCWEIHTALLPETWGARADWAAAEMLAWLWANTPCQRLITSVPAYNRLALHYAERAGMQQYGANPRSYQKHGILQDQILLGISRPSAE